MHRRVLIIPDKFKGTLTAQAAAEAIARGWRQARPRDVLELLPMTDGGDGFGAVMGRLMHGRPQRTSTVDAAGRPCVGRWWWVAGTKTAIVETATVVGLALLPPQRFHPFELDTFGLGAVLQATVRKGARTWLVGVGGSATNDGGFGLGRALGWKFLGRTQLTLARWTDLVKLARLSPPAQRTVFRGMRVAVDVQNPLLGPRGATRVYGPQKGLAPADFPEAESCLRRLACTARAELGRDLADAPGAGAAGGLAFGLMAFAGARLEPGFELFARYASLARRLRSCDLVITGEGRIDRSTLMGKGVGEIATRCRSKNIPCIGLAGSVAQRRAIEERFTKVAALLDLTCEAQAKANPGYWLEQLARKLGADLAA